MDARQERGLVIAATSKIEQNRLGWKVLPQSGNGTYVVNLDHGEPFCTCPDYEKRHQPCKHIHAVEYVIQRETKPLFHNSLPLPLIKGKGDKGGWGLINFSLRIYSWLNSSHRRYSLKCANIIFLIVIISRGLHLN